MDRISKLSSLDVGKMTELMHQQVRDTYSVLVPRQVYVNMIAMYICTKYSTTGAMYIGECGGISHAVAAAAVSSKGRNASSGVFHVFSTFAHYVITH